MRTCHFQKRHAAGEHGFTMVEIAIALGVIAFALVAIIGILPTGLQVQRDNRAETIVNQDATFWLDAIKGGTRGADDLVNHVERIDIHYNFDDPNLPETVVTHTGFRYGWEIIGLLTIPAWTNAEVYASVWSISGSAAEMEPNANDRAVAFKYRLRLNIGRDPANAVGFLDQTIPKDPTETNRFSPLFTLSNLRLTLAYPLVREDPVKPLRDHVPPPTRALTIRSALSRRFILEPVAGVNYVYFLP
jgi:type II secretory pathway pseudopilin PulG